MTTSHRLVKMVDLPAFGGHTGQKMGEWWNGRHVGLKIQCWRQHESSSLSSPTKR